jgi:hypothetical protein
MVIDLTWSVVKDVVEWAAAAHRAARGKHEQRYARVVEHTGVLVAGVSRLNNQVVALIGPLRYFDPAEWDSGRRAALVNDLILFADEGVVVPRMRTARSALQTIIVDVDDRDVVKPADYILEMADLLFEPADLAGQESTGLTGRLLDSVGPGPVMRYGARRYNPDEDLHRALPELIDLIRSARTMEDIGALRAIATSLTAMEDPPVFHSRRTPGMMLSVNQKTFDRLPVRSVLAPYAAGMQDAFGRLIAAQQRVFPGLPSPAWVF